MRAERTAGRDGMREMAGCPDRLAQAMHGGGEGWVRKEPRTVESGARF